MYQLEIKATLIASEFPKSEGWRVTVDVDAMERGLGAQSEEKRTRAAAAEQRLVDLGVVVGAHRVFGRADIVAEHSSRGTVVVEVEGESSRQREQAVYSALGQTLLVMRRFDESIRYAIAVPDQEDWVRQLRKVPAAAAERLTLRLLAVAPDSVREIEPELT